MQKTDPGLLRQSLIRSLRQQPLLVEAEKSLHSSGHTDLMEEIHRDLAMSLRRAPGMSDTHLRGFQELEGSLVEQFRNAMQAAVSSGANLAQAERELLSSLDMEKMVELRSRMDHHLSGDPEIAIQDLGIYVPAGDGLTEEFQRSLAEQLRDRRVVKDRVESRPEAARPKDSEAQVSSPYAPGAYAPAPVGRGLEEEVAEQSVRQSTQADAALDAGALRADLGLAAAGDADREEVLLESPAAQAVPADAQAGEANTYGLAAVPTLAAALEAIGRAGDDFGFLLRYGRYAPEGRRSEFLVGGLGLSELSKRLTSWLESHGSLDDQVQVIDEGSGELTIYLVGAEG